MNAIHLQDNLSKAPLAGREQAIVQASADFGQRHGVKELDRQHALDQTRTKAGEDAEGPENRVDDPPDDGRGGQRRRRRSRDDGDGPKQPVERPSPSAMSRQIDLLA